MQHLPPKQKNARSTNLARSANDARSAKQRGPAAKRRAKRITTREAPNDAAPPPTNARSAYRRAKRLTKFVGKIFKCVTTFVEKVGCLVLKIVYHVTGTCHFVETNF